MPAVMAVAGSLSDNEADCLEESESGELRSRPARGDDIAERGGI